MTSVVGILNRKGIAIAADSAVTDNYLGSDSKIIKSGNKMLRLCNDAPIAVMITDWGVFNGTPWDLIIRAYRRERRPTPKHVKDAMEDLFTFIEEHNSFCEEDDKSYQVYASGHSELVFTGYGIEDLQPSLFSADVTITSNGRLSWLQGEEVHIDDSCPVAICPFAQQDQINALKYGIEEKYLANLVDNIFKDISMLLRSDRESLRDKLSEAICSKKQAYEQHWSKAVEHYNLAQMASLAENLIHVTELYKKVQFQPENVGGLIDLALITREDGFTWLNRKSWYNPSRGGQYGKFGV